MIQWAGTNGAGIPSQINDSSPDGVAPYTTGGNEIIFRFSEAANPGWMREQSAWGEAMERLEPSSRVSSHRTLCEEEPVSYNVASGTHAGAVSRAPFIKVSWKKPNNCAIQGYYYSFNSTPDYKITKGNAPRTSPSLMLSAKSRKVSADDEDYYFHVAAVSERGRIFETGHRKFRIDTSPPDSGKVTADAITATADVLLNLESAQGVREMNISDSGHGMGRGWEPWTKNKSWILTGEEGMKTVFVQYRDRAGNTADYQVNIEWDSTHSTSTAVETRTFDLPKNSRDGDIVGVVAASGQLPITYKIIDAGDHNAFTIDSSTGEIQVGNAAKLIGDTTEHYEFSVQASKKSATEDINVIINITDGFRIPDQTFYLYKNSGQGVFVGTVTAIGSCPLSFQIKPGDNANLFIIDPGAGAITVHEAGPFDNETTPLYTLTIQATDCHGTVAEGDIAIKVVDAPEDEPGFHGQAFYLSENMGDGVVVGTPAVDGEGSFRFSIISGNESNAFDIDHDSGVITVRDAGLLDSENESDYLLMVQASGGAPETTYDIEVKIVPPARGWNVQWQNPLPTGNVLTAAWVEAPGSFYAVGEAGAIIHFAGESAYPMKSGTVKNLRDISGRIMGGHAGPELFVAGESGRILYYNVDDGEKWSVMDSGVTEDLNGIWAAPDGTNVFAVGNAGTTLRYDGERWTGKTFKSGQPLYDVAGLSNKNLFAVGAGGAILHYNGKTWASMASGVSEDLMGVWASESDVFAAGVGGVILHYDGTDWTIMEGDATENLSGVWGGADSNVYAVGANGAVQRWDGSVWRREASGSTEQLLGVSGFSDAYVVAVGRGGSILSDAGEGWTQLSRGVHDILEGVWASEAGLFVVGGGFDHDALEPFYYSTIMRGAPGDNQPQSPPEYKEADEWLQGITGVSAGNLVAVGWEGLILHHDGNRWSEVASGVDYNLFGVASVGAGDDVDAIAVGDRGVILHRIDEVWTLMEREGDATLFDVWANSWDDIFAVGDCGVIFHYNGEVWKETPGVANENFRGVWGAGGSDVFIVGDNGAILHYDGLKWTTERMVTPLGEPEFFKDVWGADGSDVFAVGDHGALYHYDGDVWSKIDAKTNLNFKSVWGYEGEVFVVGEEGTILKVIYSDL
ncbi:MAG: hypothetical protein GY859_26435 [Desulfobacterales bacterium]|nr:hypothetical protein [Desulfobacterales bacterium]